MTKVLVLGASGMLGSMVYDFLKKHSHYDLRATIRKKSDLPLADDFFIFDAATDDIANILDKFQADYIINCIGIINKYIKDDEPSTITLAQAINVEFPKHLASAAQKIGAKVIQIATDCVFSGKVGNYSESAAHDPVDAYGRTKSQGEVKADNFLNIRCSIIGPELAANKVSLLEWFLGQEAGATISGYSHQQWNGVTTLQFAELCQTIIDRGNDYFHKLVETASVHHYLPNQSVSKYELLNIFKNIWHKDINIVKVDNVGQPVDRTLATEFYLLSAEPSAIPMATAVQALHDYIV